MQTETDCGGRWLEFPPKHAAPGNTFLFTVRLYGMFSTVIDMLYCKKTMFLVCLLTG